MVARHGLAPASAKTPGRSVSTVRQAFGTAEEYCMPWQPTGWYRFRSVARRIPGFWVMSCGAALARWSVWLPAHPHWPLDANAPRLTTAGYGLVLLPAAAVCTGSALWWLHSRTYRPARRVSRSRSRAPTDTTESGGSESRSHSRHVTSRGALGPSACTIRRGIPSS